MSRWCVDDLVLLRDAGVQIDADDFREAYRPRIHIVILVSARTVGLQPFNNTYRIARGNPSSAIRTGMKRLSGETRQIDREMLDSLCLRLLVFPGATAFDPTTTLPNGTSLSFKAGDTVTLQASNPSTSNVSGVARFDKYLDR
jgi:hypothetical protein